MLSRAKAITDARAAAVFCNSTLRRILLSLTQPRSVGALARESGMDLKRLHYHVSRLRRLGLVDVVEVTHRAGRPIKIYRAISSAFFIPFAVAPELYSEGLARELRSILRDDADSAGAGVLFFSHAGGKPIAQLVRRQETQSSPTEMWRLLRLSASEAQELKSELRALFDRFAHRSGSRGDTYIAHAAVARRRAETFSVDNVPSL